MGNNVHLKCSYSQFPPDASVGYLVVWSRLSIFNKKEPIHRETTLQTFSLLEMDGVNFRLGDTVFCSVTVFHRNAPHQKSISKEGEGFYVGIRFIPETLHIAEDGKEHVLTIISTVPISCRSETDVCKVTLKISIIESDSSLPPVPNIALSSCQVELMSKPCRGTGCAAFSLTLKAVADFARDGTRVSYIKAEPLETGESLWKGYSPKEAKVSVQDIPTAYCYSFTDPHIITFDGRFYENQKTGTFVFYKSVVRELEVHVRQWNCGSRHHAVSCNCGVAAKEGNEIVYFDMCNGQRQETIPHLSIRNVGSSKQQVKIRTSYHGKKITIMFPSGAFVRADVSDWGMSLTVRAPSIDFNGTRGLCGIFDNKGHNDFHRADGSTLLLHTMENLEDFIEEWRIIPGNSFFDKTPAPVEEETRRHYCTCPKYTDSIHSTKNKHLVNNSSQLSLSCLSNDDVDYTSIIPYVDVTSEYPYFTKVQTLKSDEAKTQSNPSYHKILSESYNNYRLSKHKQFLQHNSKSSGKHVGSENTDNSGGDRSLYKANVKEDAETIPFLASQTLNHSDLDRFAYLFPDDHFAVKWPVIEPSWPTSNGLTSAKALEACKQALLNSTIGFVCKDLLGRRLDEAINMCLVDLHLKDDLMWVDAMVPFLENECESKVLENRITPHHSMGGDNYEEIITALRCPNFCNGNGQCLESGCRCFQGHLSYDCSAIDAYPPEITDLENSGLCDIRVYECDSIRVFGLGFRDFPDLQCELTRLIYDGRDWLPRERETSAGIYLSSEVVDCTFPFANRTDAEPSGFLTDNLPFARWSVKVSNDGFLYSNDKILTIYDAICQVCDPHIKGLCKLKEKACMINGLCYGEGESSPSSPCLLCEPTISRFTWSIKQNHLAPVFQAPSRKLKTFFNENFVYQLSAMDPEGTAVLFTLESAPQGASISPAGLLAWKANSSESQLFEFTVSDECNAKSRHLVEVIRD
ncbi:von Willebrand factor D and EGF domain-containing protein-like [Lissotriton helveticus]